jgi:hypothetical protein
MCTIMLARLVFEPVVFGYYLVPATAIALVWCARNGEPLALRALTSSLLCAFCLVHTFPSIVFFAILGLGLGYVCGPAVRAWWAATPPRGAERAQGGEGSKGAHMPAMRRVRGSVQV